MEDQPADPSSDQPPQELPTTQPPQELPTTQPPQEVPTTQPPQELPTTDPPTEQPTSQPAEAPDSTPAVDATAVNGEAGTAPLDANAFGVNGFPMNADPSFVAASFDPMQASMMGMPSAQPMTADEIALYDRQIRLWGVKAQEKIRSANILLVGMKALGSEIAKNLVLAGVGTLTILDHETVTDDDLGAQFFVSQERIGQNRAQAAQAELQKLNPRVNLFVDPDVIFTKLPEYFSSFDMTICTGLPLDALTSINMTCRMFNRKFYAADTHGMYGFIFSDLIIHQFVQEVKQSNKPPKPSTSESATRLVLSVTQKEENGNKIDVITKQEIYNPLMLVNSSPLPAEATKSVAKKRKVTPLLTCLRALFDFQVQSGGRLPSHNRQDLQLFTQLANQKHLELQLPTETLKSEFLRSFLQNLGAELSPVAAFLGGHLAQDVINVLGQREQPLQNFLLFDGEAFQASEYSIQPIFDESMNIGMNVGTNGNGSANGMDVNAADMGTNGVPAAA